MSNFARKIEKTHFHSAALGEARSIRISYPPGFDPARLYPVLIGQDGEELFNFGRIVTQANTMMAAGEIRPIFIVGIDSVSATRTAEYHPDGERFPEYCRFIADELLSFLEQQYPVSDRADDRVLIGDSLGGTVSLHLALDRPHLFQKVVSFSGAFYDPTRLRITEETDLSALRVYQTVGLGEEAFETPHGVVNILDMNRITKRLLKERNADVTYIETEGTHIWGAWQPLIPGALRHFFG